MTHSDIPLFPVFRRGQQDSTEILASMNAIVETGDFIGFSAVNELEAHLEDKFRIDHAVGLSSGTAAIQGLFEYFDINDRDMVVVPANLGKYRIRNLGNQPMVIHKTMLKEGFQDA